MTAVTWSTDVAQADWIGPRLGPFASGAVTSVVPAGFESYARILHPARDAEGRPLRWSEVAARHDLEVPTGGHFAEVSLRPPGEPAGVPGLVGPEEGTLPAAYAAALIHVLRRHTATPRDCWFCLWDGYGWMEPAADEERIPRSALAGPRVELPHREYLLHHGDVDATLAFVETENQTPNLWWPRDRAWCVASEIDLESTYIGGPVALVDAIISDDRIEAQPVDPAETHDLRLPRWLLRQIDDAAAEVRAGREGRVETSLGSVTASARLRGRLRRGELWTGYVRVDGSAHGDSWTDLSARNDDELHAAISHQLAFAVLDLLG